MANVKYNLLSVRKVKAIKDPGKYPDGNCLWLIVDDNLNKRWVVIVTYRGRRHELGAGSAREVSLAEARERRDQYRRQIRDGSDPLAEKRKARETPTFEEYSRKLYEQIKHEWRNEKHSTSWLRSLELYAFPSIGRLPVNEVDGPSITDTLRKIWKLKPETARRTKQRIGRVLSAAIAENLRPGPNPAIDVNAALGKKRAKAQHLRSMPFAEVPKFYERLDATEMAVTSRVAFQFLILTAGRTSEILNAVWPEIDLRKKLWIIPHDRMKANEEHSVPLSPEAIRILKIVRDHNDGSEFVFPGNRQGTPFSNMVFAAALKRMDEPFTAHGFRSSFRDWAEEQTAYPHAAMEAALAHKVHNKVEAAYRRTKLLEVRRKMMTDWANFITGKKNG